MKRTLIDLPAGYAIACYCKLLRHSPCLLLVEVLNKLDLVNHLQLPEQNSHSLNS
jgi:hypothetical protein